MKKLLCGFLCVSAGALLATEVTVATVDVIAVDSGLKNTIVAIPGLDLAGGKLVVSNLVKTSNLTIGDKLYAFVGGEYESWELKNGAGGRYWDHAAQRYTISSAGAVESASTPASNMRMDVGSGIWLSRTGDVTTGHPFYIYAAHTNELSTTVAANTEVLLGNPLTGSDKAPSITGAQSGDKIILPGKFLKTYTYSGSAWTSSSGSGLPTITRGTGFWYKSVSDGSDRTVSW